MKGSSNPGLKYFFISSGNNSSVSIHTAQSTHSRVPVIDFDQPTSQEPVND